LRGGDRRNGTVSIAIGVAGNGSGDGSDDAPLDDADGARGE
jgi:hypothetical protein